MATTDYDFNQTRNELIARAYRIIGKQSDLGPVSAEMIEQGQIALNGVVKSWATKHVFLWAMESQTITATADTATTVLGNDVLFVDRAYRVDTNADVRLELISFRDYQNIVDKDSSGAPYCMAIDYAKSTPTAYFWPVQTANTSIKIFVAQRLEDMDTASGNADIPQRFLEALQYALAATLADEFGLQLNERAYLKQRADELFAYAKQSDNETQDYDSVSSAFPYWIFK